MKFSIPFRSWTLKAALEVEIADDTPEPFRLKTAVVVAVGQKAYLGDADLRDAELLAANNREVERRRAAEAERFAHMPPFRAGESIGIMFKWAPEF